MIKPIVLYGNQILRNPTLPYKEKIDLTETVKNLFDTMYAARGAGLAAPQINLSERIFVVDLPSVGFKKVFINPKIIQYSGNDLVMDEGCLSLPGLEASIVRKRDIEIEYYDENWKLHTEIFSDIKSRVIQHEYDHLDGVLWIDRIDPAVGIRFLEDLRKIINKEVEVTYPII